MNGTPLDEARLGAWLDATLPGPAARATAEQIDGGASNIIYRVRRGERMFALRRPPTVKNDPTSNNMRRELTLLKALGKTSIPHPRLVAAGEDDSIIGVPFALMEWIDGFTPKTPLPEGFGDATAARRMAEGPDRRAGYRRQCGLAGDRAERLRQARQFPHDARSIAGLANWNARGRAICRISIRSATGCARTRLP